MRTTIKAKVHLLATDNDNPTQVSIMRLPQKNKLYSHVAGGEFRKGLQMGHQPQHLYFTTDEEIKEGDWFICTPTTKAAPSLHKCGNPTGSVKYVDTTAGFGLFKNLCRKIVATTNPELCLKLKDSFPNKEAAVIYWNIPPIPKIDIPFVEAYIKVYNEGSPITEVLIEQEKVYQQYEEPKGVFNKNPDKLVLKLKSNGSVIVHPVTKKTYTRQEVIQILCTLKSYLVPPETIVFRDDLRKWLDNNYPE